MPPTNSSNFEQGTIITANILFSDMAGAKLRPALVISSTEYNKKFADIIVLKITSAKEKPFPFNVDIADGDVFGGKLKKECTIMADFPVTLAKEQVSGIIGRLSEKKLAETKQKMKTLFSLK